METPTERRLSAAQVFAMALEAEAQGQADRAETYFSALTQQNGLVPGAANLAVQSENEGHFERAEAILRAGLARAPDSAELKGRLGRMRLREGDFAEGWALSEFREIRISAQIQGRPKLPFPEWDGGPVGSLLVFTEQGYGDQIQFARYLRVLVDQGMQVTFVGAPELEALFEPLGARFAPAVRGQALPRCDAWTMLMSLPYRLGTRLETIPPAPYLPASRGGSGVGVMVSGNPNHPRDAERSLPAEAAQRLLALPGAVDLSREATGARDFRETARTVDGLAEVITVDTAIAHLAGAMGKPTRLLLPFVADWRWLRDRTDSPWYPSMKLYRQPTRGDWDGVLAALAADGVL